ncbi:MAG: RNA 2'-phosphotransferase [Myxococcota bacterium]
MDPSLVSLSNFLSRVLRHRPESIGIVLDAQGWVEIGTLLERAAANGKPIDRADFDRVVADNDKQRFALSEDGIRIRARQGHSIEVDLGLEAVTPPDLLFHGTVERFLTSIRHQGLRKKQRTHVHLSATESIARQVGGRRGEAVVLKVESGRMAAEGFAFYRSENGVWLVDRVPRAFLLFPRGAIRRRRP